MLSLMWGLGLLLTATPTCNQHVPTVCTRTTKGGLLRPSSWARPLRGLAAGSRAAVGNLVTDIIKRKL